MGTVRPTSNIDLLHGMIEGYFVTYASSLIIVDYLEGYKGGILITSVQGAWRKESTLSVMSHPLSSVMRIIQ